MSQFFAVDFCVCGWEILVRTNGHDMQKSYMFTKWLLLLSQHSLLSGWPLYITAIEGFLRHEISVWASWESSLPIFKWVGIGSLVCFYNCILSRQTTKLVLIFAIGIVNPILCYILVISLHLHAPAVKLFFHSLAFNCKIFIVNRGGMFIGVVSLPCIFLFFTFSFLSLLVKSINAFNFVLGGQASLLPTQFFDFV